jgi:hypothetical protein
LAGLLAASLAPLPPAPRRDGVGLRCCSTVVLRENSNGCCCSFCLRCVFCGCGGGGAPLESGLCAGAAAPLSAGLVLGVRGVGAGGLSPGACRGGG